MTKTDLVAALAQEMGLALRKSDDIVNLVFHTMIQALIKGERIEVRNFGSFEVRQYRPYMGMNPSTGEKVAVGKKRLPFFKAGKELMENANLKVQS